MREVLLEGARGLRLRCRVAERRRERVRGLLGRMEPDADAVLLIPNASSVHTFGMRIPILVARLDDDLRIVDLRRVPPRRLVLPSLSCRHVLEGAIGLDLRVGDSLRLVAGRADG